MSARCLPKTEEMDNGCACGYIRQLRALPQWSYSGGSDSSANMKHLQKCNQGAVHHADCLSPNSCNCQGPMPGVDSVQVRGVSLDRSCCPPLSLRCLLSVAVGRPPSASGTSSVAGWAAP